MKKIILLHIGILFITSFLSCEDDDSKCPRGEREFELPDGTITCIKDISVPQNPFPLFPNQF